MKTILTSNLNSKGFKMICRLLLKVVFIVLTLILSLSQSGCGNTIAIQDTSGNIIQAQLKKLKHSLYFPQTTERFYRQTGNRLAWVFPDTVKSCGWEAMLMLDCVIQFGLNHDDFHPGKLLSVEMHRLTRNFNTVSANDKAAFDVLLTDALITFMNNLHYGKLNPAYNAQKIDGTDFKGFHADNALISALSQNDFMSAVLSAQPDSKAYHLLQSRMRLMTGQYVGDCYEVPQGEVRKIAINMERLRWADLTGESYIHINIPSYDLNYRLPDTVYQFKVVVGKPAHPTPALESAVNYVTTVPGRRAGCDIAMGPLAFHFSNISNIYLHDTPEKELFNYNVRAYTNGCIHVNNAVKLAELLMDNDGSGGKVTALKNAVKTGRTRNFYLKKPLPIKVTYLTCADSDGLLVIYDDIYNLDKNLERALYGIH